MEFFKGFFGSDAKVEEPKVVDNQSEQNDYEKADPQLEINRIKARIEELSAIPDSDIDTDQVEELSFLTKKLETINNYKQ